MGLAHIAVFIAAALLFVWALPVRWRRWALLVASVIAVYWLQPPLPIRYLDFVLPTATLALSVIVWWVTQKRLTPDLSLSESSRSDGVRNQGLVQPSSEGLPQKSSRRASSLRRPSEDHVTLAVLAALVLALSLTRYLVPELRPTASRAPEPLAVIAALAVLAGVVRLIARLARGWRGLISAVIALIAGLFVILKTDPLAASLSGALRTIAGQNPELSSILDIRWLGFSYIAFRLLHVLRDRQTGKLPALSLREHMTYVIFFPALTAGPIDRAERFAHDERALPETLTAPCLVEAFERITAGLVKKFVIGDSLALFALNAANAEQAVSAPALWLLLYAYAFRLLLDFSGYTDIAIGIGLLVGIRLPENFNRPYLKPNLAAFWQSWHMTLSSWARFYVFSPLSRALLARKVHALAAVFIAQMATMAVIGLWHAVAWNFLIWGLWHGLGLFAHKLWSDRTRKRYLALKQRPRLERVWNAAGMFLTFHFVALGWVWFALADVGQASRVLLRLFGINA